MDAAPQNLLLMLLCYAYIVALILVSDRLPLPEAARRKFLHAMIGNLPFIIPFFTASIYPFLVASPFILVTFLVTPYSPVKGLRERLPGLANITEEGHHMGLILYAISYSVLAYLYGLQPYVIAAGILPMAYGDSLAALVGMRHGRHRYRVFETKSLEGSAAMFVASLAAFGLSLAYFSYLYGFSLGNQLVPALAVAAVVTVAEAVSPKGLDNVLVPIAGALTFVLANGGA
jgi:dolichol kinase